VPGPPPELPQALTALLRGAKVGMGGSLDALNGEIKVYFW